MTLCLLLAVGIAGTVGYGVMFARQSETDCDKVPSVVAAYTRSGSYSLLHAFVEPNETFSRCFEPIVRISLLSRASLVRIYQTLCKYIETQPFQVQYDLHDIVSINGGQRPVFNENYSPHNYFTKGDVQVEIINTTTNSSSVDINLCLFTNNNDYNGFMQSGAYWRNYTENGVCHSITVENGKNFSTSFNVGRPSFVFLAMVSTGYIHLDQLSFSATGQDIIDPGKNGSANLVCTLDGEHLTAYTFDVLKHQFGNQNVCIVAYEVGNGDGSYDYSDLTVSLPYRIHSPYYTELLEGFGFGSIAVLIVIVAMLALTVILVRVCRRKRMEVTCSPISEEAGHCQKEEGMIKYPIVVESTRESWIDKI